MGGVVGVPEIYPAEVRTVLFYTFLRLTGNTLIVVENVHILLLVGEVCLVQIVAVKHIVYLKVAGLRLALSSLRIWLL